MTTSEQDIDERARQMSDGERDDYLLARGWQFVGAGWIPPSGPEDQAMGGRIQMMTSGLYSRSTAIREQLAREDQDSVPNELGRYYHGAEPQGGGRW
jgi:hypothetical protein